MSACVLHREVSGPPDAPALVLVGSLGTTLSMWTPQVRELARRFRVVACDVRGHGKSPAPRGPYSVAELGSDLLGVVDELEIEHASLCGLSIGAMMSLWVAAHASSRVRRLVACCTTACFEPLAAERYRERAARVRTDGLEPIADGVIERWLTSAFRACRPDVVARLRADLVATPAEGYASCCEALAGLDLRPKLPDITAPTLVVAGEQDEATPAAQGRAIANAVPGALFELVPEAAHLATVERPELLSALILRFLSDAKES